MKQKNFLLTCEHSSKTIPAWLHKHFKDFSFEEHETYDPGALVFSKLLQEKLEAPLFLGKVSRLVVDLNRTLGEDQFSKVTRQLSFEEKEKLLSRYYNRYQGSIFESILQKCIKGESVIHLSCHTFTPVFHGTKREVFIGILFDPKRKKEARFAKNLKKYVETFFPFPVRYNEPYEGTSDGLTTFLRLHFTDDEYLGIEIELSQALFQGKMKELWRYVWCPKFIDALKNAQGGL